MDHFTINQGKMVYTPKTKRQRILARLALIILVIVAGIVAMLIATPNAKADGILTDYEKRWGDSTAEITCEYFLVNGAVVESLFDVGLAISKVADISLSNARDVINYQVATYCPEYIPAINSFSTPEAKIKSGRLI